MREFEYPDAAQFLKDFYDQLGDHEAELFTKAYRQYLSENGSTIVAIDDGGYGEFEFVEERATSMVAVPGPTPPPHTGETFLGLVLSNVELEFVLGDLAEIYADKLTRCRSSYVNVWYWCQAVRSAISFLSGKLLAWVVAEAAKRLRG